MLQTAGAIGWRAQVTAKGRDKGSNKPKVKVFGQWYALEDESVIRPIEQVRHAMATERGGRERQDYTLPRGTARGHVSTAAQSGNVVTREAPVWEKYIGRRESWSFLIWQF